MEHSTIKLLQNTNKINIQKGIWQGDTISPKLFNLALEQAFKHLQWQDKGLIAIGRSADDVVLIADNPEHLIWVLNEFNETLKSINLQKNLNKAKVMCTEDPQIVISNH